MASALARAIMTSTRSRYLGPGIAVRSLPGRHKPQRTIYATWLRIAAVAPMLGLLTEAAVSTAP
jgi:hypothetical protein